MFPISAGVFIHKQSIVSCRDVPSCLIDRELTEGRGMVMAVENTSPAKAGTYS